MPKFRKKPIVIEAMEYTRILADAEKVAKWCNGLQNNEGILIPTLESDMQGVYGDWIIKGVEGEFYPCKPEIFNKTYEPVETSFGLGPK